MWLTYFTLFALIVPPSCLAQQMPADTDLIAEGAAPIQGGQTAEIGVSRVGQRQNAAQAAQAASVKPMARLNGRIRNRVQARIRNRIDQYYDPKANATSPFIVAGQEARRQ